ncbi:hypothetical protein [Alloactinosynnema sp. L-07]|uniref:hypothetical protein n=1 Tax=Alloactinosynnema sp. L-07 TaxID=1653480 RepID=UPI0006B59745|nr:hypothetical protein [Alloactinosynnema sp. L-07]
MLDGYTKLFVQPRNGFRKEQIYSWHLNQDRGVPLGKIGTFYASMKFEVIDADQSKYDKPFRVTTREYNYKLEGPDGSDQWRMHWHPDSRVSPERYPHMHLPPDLKIHRRTSRMTFEAAITWCIALGAPLSVETAEALQIVTLTEARHVLWRGWSNHPDEVLT